MVDTLLQGHYHVNIRKMLNKALIGASKHGYVEIV